MTKEQLVTSTLEVPAKAPMRGIRSVSSMFRSKEGAEPQDVPIPPLAHSILKHIQRGQLVITFPNGSSRTYGRERSYPSCTWNIHSNALLHRLVREGSLGLGESYMEGEWSIEDGTLRDFFCVLFQNELWRHIHEDLRTQVRIWVQELARRPTRLLSSRNNVRDHYDLGNSFFSQMLDSSMTYSCGYQHSKEDTLYDLQQNKYALTAKKLAITPEPASLIDVGCGWGGMLDYITKNYPSVHTTGITLSEQQHQYANQLFRRSGNSCRAQALLLDYRELDGAYDYFVSIGMFEHVGKERYPEFMKMIQRVLRPGGRGLLHTISSASAPEEGSDPWLMKYIFPGGYLPRLEEITYEMRKAGLTILHVENLREHYVHTIAHWRRNFERNRKRIQALGSQFNDRFLRMWEFYLHSVEASFHAGPCQLYQVLFERSSF